MSESNGAPKPEPLFIADGETRTAYLAESPGQYPAVRFTYRRATYGNLMADANGLFDAAPDKQIEKSAELVAKRLIGMAQVGPAPEFASVPIAGEITAERLLTLDPYLFTRIMHVVKGLITSDPDPRDAIVQQTAETDLKNSEAGCDSYGSTPKSQPVAAMTAPSGATMKQPAA